MTTFVLVHGAWSGAHVFRLVRPRLRAAGHEVFTPSLTGIGERVHLASPQVNLTTHVRDVVNAILYEDLSDIVLVGFSYGGFVVTGAIEHIGDRVRHLAYLDAFVPADGQSPLEVVSGGPVPVSITLGEPWQVDAPDREFDDPNEAAFASARRVPHPIGCFTEPVRVPRPLEEHPFSRTYIKATDEGPDTAGGAAFWAAAEMARQSSAWSYAEIATTHMIPVNRPDELVEILLALG
jgi:pimeloyl-ACP methyl ester carboxylesterase